MSAPRHPVGPAPLRRPGSVRRTTSIETHWPDGYGQPMVMEGRARDVLTDADGGRPRVIDEGAFRILASARREILEIAIEPADPRAHQLVGVRAGGASRQALGDLLGEYRGRPLFPILDDFAGASLVAGWVWSRWISDWRDRAAKSGLQSTAGRGGIMEGICTGFAPGSSALTPDGRPEHAHQSAAEVGPIVHPEDPDGWHRLGDQAGIAKRRSRRLDLWRGDGGLLEAELDFQDSGTAPGGKRVAVHEYRVTATIDPGSMTLAAIKADPRVLPYPECPGAAANVQRMVGRPVADFRNAVLETLPGTLGCTHLNDVLRSLADVPSLAPHLPD